MLAHEYSTCQYIFERNFEVIGGAGVRAGEGKLETRKQKLEKEGIAIREPRQIHKNKDASVRRGEE
jgi:hypothetical protein